MTSTENQPQNDDTITQLFESGQYHILENIFIDMPVETLLNYRKVSNTWNKIISYFQQSTNPRVKRLLENRLDNAWLNKEYFFQKFQLPVPDDSTRVIVHHIISDSSNLVIATSEDTITTIFIYDQENLNLLTTLKTNWNIDADITSMEVLMNDDVLVASIQIQKVPRNSEDPLWHEIRSLRLGMGFNVWDRRNNYANKANIISLGDKLPESLNIVLPPGQHVTLSNNDVVQFLLIEGRRAPFYRKWEASSNYSVDNISVLYYLTEGGFNDYRFISKDEFLRCFDVNISLFNLANKFKPVWSISLQSAYICRVKGHSLDYLALSIYDERNNEYMTIYNMRNGSLVKNFTFPNAGESLFKVHRVQFGGHRVAVLGLLRSPDSNDVIESDVLVLDLRTGLTIFKLSQVFDHSNFRILRIHLNQNYLAVADNKEIYVFRYGI